MSALPVAQRAAWADPTTNSLARLLSRISTFCLVEVQKLRHDRSELVTRAIQPILWLVIFGQTFSHIRAIPTGDVPYLDFLAPGIIAQSALFVAIFYGIQIIWERDAGVLTKLMVTPTPRAALVTGKAFAAGIRAVAQAVVVVVVAALLGVSMTWNPIKLLGVAERRQTHRDALFRELVEGGRRAARASADNGDAARLGGVLDFVPTLHEAVDRPYVDQSRIASDQIFRPARAAGGDGADIESDALARFEEDFAADGIEPDRAAATPVDPRLAHQRCQRDAGLLVAIFARHPTRHHARILHRVTRLDEDRPYGRRAMLQPVVDYAKMRVARPQKDDRRTAVAHPRTGPRPADRKRDRAPAATKGSENIALAKASAQTKMVPVRGFEPLA